MFFSRMLDERTLKVHQEAFMEFVDTVGDYVKGEAWLNIIEIARTAKLDDYKDRVIRPKMNEVFELNELTIDNMPLIRKKLELTPSQVEYGEESYRRAHDRKSTFQKRMEQSAKKLKPEEP